MQSQPYHRPLHASKRLRLTSDTTFFHFVKEHEPRKGSGLKTPQASRPDISQVRVVEDDGIEPTTPCLQSRCSPS